MSLTQQDREWHKRYEALPEETRDTIDLVWQQAFNTLTAKLVPAATDDRAEALVAAITRYVVESQR